MALASAPHGPAHQEPTGWLVFRKLLSPTISKDPAEQLPRALGWPVGIESVESLHTHTIPV